MLTTIIKISSVRPSPAPAVGLCLLFDLQDASALVPCRYRSNPHKCSGLQHKFIVFQFWKSEVQNQFHWAQIKVSAGPPSFWRLQGRIHSLPFSASRGCPHSLASGPASLQPPLPLCLLPSDTHRDPSGCTGLTQRIQDHLPIRTSFP